MLEFYYTEIVYTIFVIVFGGCVNLMCQKTKQGMFYLVSPVIFMLEFKTVAFQVRQYESVVSHQRLDHPQKPRHINKLVDQDKRPVCCKKSQNIASSIRRELPSELFKLADVTFCASIFWGQAFLG